MQMMLNGWMLSRLVPCLTKRLNPRILTPAAGTADKFLLKRCYAAERANYVQVERDSSVEGVAWVRLNRKPVNSLNRDMLMELILALDNIENNDTYRGVILTSANPGTFSAGLDILDFYQKDQDYIRSFWTEVQNMWLKMYSSPLAIIAAVNGNCPAGGCIMTLSCDHRIMAAGKYVMGLNEVKLGIVAPGWLQDSMVNTVGVRRAESALQLGTLFSPEEALSVGMIDEVVPQEKIEEAARDEIKKWMKIPDMARMLSKQMIRNQTIEKFNNNRENELEMVSSFMASGGIQKSLGRYMESLSKHKK